VPAAHLGATHPPTPPKQDDFYLTLTMTLPLFFRLKARRGYKRAVVAIAHKILVAIYHMLSQQVSHNDLGDLYQATAWHKVTATRTVVTAGSSSNPKACLNENELELRGRFFACVGKLR